MENLDRAYQVFSALLERVGNISETIITEQDTRLKVIDPVFIEVLEWPIESILTEDRAGQGYIDYRLNVGASARLIVEAKRDSRAFGLDKRECGRAYKLNGPTFRNKDVQEGINQAITYCGRKNAELACVTNGREWVIFRGSRLGDGLDTEEGVAFIFPTLQGIKDQFLTFFSLMSFHSVQDFSYRAYFQEAEGLPIRSHRKGRPVIPNTSRVLVQRSELANDLDRVMTAFFQRIGSEDREMMMHCFVETSESRFANQRLARISEDLVSSVRSLDTEHGTALAQIIDRARSSSRNEFVLLIGTKGAGKSTFIERFFEEILSRDVAKHCKLVKVDLKESHADEFTVIPWLDRALLNAIEKGIFNGYPNYNELQGMFFDEYVRWSEGPFKHQYETDKTQFKIDFGRHVERMRSEQTSHYIARMISHMVAVRKILPCLVFDNADHFNIEFQERVFQYARSIYEGGLCLVIVPITDKTSWQLSRQGALQSYENEVLYLPTPTPAAVIESRIRFLQHVVDDDGERGVRYLVDKNVYLTLDRLKAFAWALQEIFAGDGAVSRLIGSFANHDIRSCLDLTRLIVASPHVGIVDLIRAFINGSTAGIDREKIVSAIIKLKYDVYPVGLHPYIQNLFALNDEVETTPLLGVRILLMLRTARFESVAGGEPYVDVSQVRDYFAAMRIEPRYVDIWMDSLLKSSLCLAYDPTQRDIAFVGRIELSPSGERHLDWALSEPRYLESMALVTPIYHPYGYDRLSETWRRGHRSMKEIRKLFFHYLIKEDAEFCSVPNHPAYREQQKIKTSLEQLI